MVARLLFQDGLIGFRKTETTPGKDFPSEWQCAPLCALPFLPDLGYKTRLKGSLRSSFDFRCSGRVLDQSKIPGTEQDWPREPAPFSLERWRVLWPCLPTNPWRSTGLCRWMTMSPWYWILLQLGRFGGVPALFKTFFGIEKKIDVLSMFECIITKRPWYLGNRYIGTYGRY